MRLALGIRAFCNTLAILAVAGLSVTLTAVVALLAIYYATNGQGFTRTENPVLSNLIIGLMITTGLLGATAANWIQNHKSIAEG